MQLVLSWSEDDGDGVVVVLGVFKGQVEGEAGSGVASLPAGGRVIDTSLVAVHVDQPLVHSIAESDYWQSQYEYYNMHGELAGCTTPKFTPLIYTCSACMLHAHACMTNCCQQFVTIVTSTPCMIMETLLVLHSCLHM